MAEFRAVLKGKLATGEFLEIHETMLPPGGDASSRASSRPFRNVAVREGTVEFNRQWREEQSRAGRRRICASNDEHGVTNVGKTPAKYFVVAVGPERAS